MGNTLSITIFVPAGNSGFGNYSLKTFNACGSNLIGHGAVVGTAPHGHSAVGPVCFNGNGSGFVGEGMPSFFVVDPFHNVLEGRNFCNTSAGFKTFRTFGSKARRFDNGKTSDKEVVMPCQTIVKVT